MTQSSTRSCQDCGEPIPDNLRKGTKFCSKTCQTREASRRYQRKLDPAVKKQRFKEFYNKTGKAAAAEAWAETRAELDGIVAEWLERLTNHYNIENADSELKEYLRNEIEMLPTRVRDRLEYEFCVELEYE